MRTLSRPLFNMGGPIKQGIMNGIREPHKDGNIVGGHQSPLLAGAHPIKDKSGREHHFLPALAAAAMRFGPAAYRGWKASKWLTPGKLGKWGRAKDIFWPRKGVTGPKLKGELYKTPFTPVSGAEKAGFGVGSYIGTNPITSFGIASTIPQAGYLGAKAAGAAPGALWSGAKRYADMVIPGDQSRWWKDKEPPTGVPLNPNLQKLISAVDAPPAPPKKLSEAERKAFALKQREERVNKYMEMMGYDRAKKTAIADALIDASKIVGDRGTLDLKNISRELINPVIQATSKRLDKPEQIREAVGLMATKAEIEKDLSAETDALAKTLKTEQIEGLRRQAKEDSIGGDIRAYNTKHGKLPTGTNLAELVRLRGGEVSGVPNTTEVKKWMKDNKKDEVDYLTQITTTTAVDPGIYVVNNRILIVDENNTVQPYQY